MNDLDKLLQAWADGLGVPVRIKAGKIPEELADHLRAELGYLPTGRELAHAFRRCGWQRITLGVAGYRGGWLTRLSPADDQPDAGPENDDADGSVI